MPMIDLSRPMTHKYDQETVELVDSTKYVGGPTRAEVMAKLHISASTFRRIRAAHELEVTVQIDLAVARITGIGEALGIAVEEQEALRILWEEEDGHPVIALVMQLGAAKTGVPTLFPSGSARARTYAAAPTGRAPDLDDFFSAPPTSKFDDLLDGLGD